MKNKTKSKVRPPRRRMFRMPDGKVIRAHDYEELAIKMRNSAFFPGKDLNEYMLDVAKRVYIMHSVTISAWAPEQFIRDLIFYKLITEILPN